MLHEYNYKNFEIEESRQYSTPSVCEELRRLAAEPYVEVYAYGASAPAFQYISTPAV